MQKYRFGLGRFKLNIRALLLLAVFLVSIVGNTALSVASSCTVSAASQTAERQISVDVDCPDAKFFRLSESSDFNESPGSGVNVQVDYVDPDKKFADISVTYPDGVQGQPESEFSVTDEPASPKALVVLFDFAGQEYQLSDYATPTWANNLVFDGNFDGRNVLNDIKSYIAQSTYGAVDLGGDVHPEIIYLEGFDTLRDPDTTSSKLMARELADKLAQEGIIDPQNNPYDMLVGLTAGGMSASGTSFYSMASIDWNYQGFAGNFMNDIPVDSSSPLYATRNDEPATVNQDGIVIPRYNPDSVEGVWLATNTDHSGHNYFGELKYGYQGDINMNNSGLRYITPNQSLAEGTSVIVTYNPDNVFKISDALKAVSPPDTLLEESRWYGAWAHEFMHAADWLMIRPPADQNMPVADMYNQPWELTNYYDIMSTGAYNFTSVHNDELQDNIEYTDPSHFNGHSKMQMGIMAPLTLNYGQNQSGIRIYQTEETDFSNSSSRTKLVKIPLKPGSDPGFLQLVGDNDEIRKYSGEEYLLLEWRSKTGFSGQDHNFDQALPHEGLIVYRAIDSGETPEPFLHGWDQDNTIQIIDATPPKPPFSSLDDYRSRRQSNLADTPATFGPGSDNYQYVAGADWSWKENTTASADFLLSPGDGTKTIYAQFKNLDGSIVNAGPIQVTLETSDTQAPSTPANLHSSGQTTTSIDLEWDPSTDDTGVTGYKIYQDDNEIDQTGSTTYTASNLSPGTYYKYNVAAFDEAGNVSPLSDSITVRTKTCFTLLGNCFINSSFIVPGI